MNRSMFYNANPETFVKARALRNRMTDSEKILWLRINKNQLRYRFKPQHPIDIFIADFYCHQLKLIIEIDGDSHNNKIEKDASRTAELNTLGIEVIRFTNDEVQNEIENVLEKIRVEILNLQMKNKIIL